ncbi:MAG: cytochrome b [Wenzhouxiangellaceae bacterium]
MFQSHRRKRYDPVAQLLHWVVALGVILQFIWAWRIDEADSRAVEYALVVQHKSIGMLVLMLAVLRILWRLFHRPPPLPSGTPAWQRAVSSMVHWALYVLIIAQPLSGWIWSSAAGYGAELFGWVEVPDLVAENEALADLMHDVHETMAWLLLGLASLHVVAALWHQFVRRDGLLWRMLPWGGR